MRETTGTRALFAVLAGIVRPALNSCLAKRYEGFGNLPEGGAIVCPNHVTEIDPLVVGHALYNHGRVPRYLAKGSLFDIPVVGRILHASRQVPVERTGPGAGRSLEIAHEIVDGGGTIVVYPEGTLTRDPDLWPMRGRTGAARLALRTGAPVVPMAHWGAQEVLPRYGKRLHLFPRKRLTVRVGPVVDLDDLRGGPVTRAVLEEATRRITAAITRELAAIRGGEPPAAPWDPAAHGQPETGRDFDPGAAAGDRA